MASIPTRLANCKKPTTQFISSSFHLQVLQLELIMSAEAKKSSSRPVAQTDLDGNGMLRREGE
jgi:hypothetical protein